MTVFRHITFIITLASFTAFSIAEDCTVLVRDSLCLPGQPCVEESYFCEAQDGQFLDLSLTGPQTEELDLMVANGQASSGLNFLSYSSSEVNNGTLTPASINLQSNTNRRRRRLTKITGDSYYLVVKAFDMNGLAISDTPQEMSDNWFGPSDPVHLKSQMRECSGGQYNVIPGYNPAVASSATAFAFDNAKAAPGVIEVTIPIDITGNYNRMNVAQYILMEVSSLLSLPPSSFPGPFDHIILVVEQCYTDCGWGAWANVQHWLSVFQAEYYKSARTQMHEIGHNFGLDHSGIQGQLSVADHTCSMGNPLYGDDQGKMCYNPAKSYFLNWYDTVTYYPLFDGPWNGNLMGAGEWDTNPSAAPVSIRIVTGNTEDYFVGFNRAAGANSQNVEGDDAVTVTMARGDKMFSQSWRVFLGYAGDTYSIGNFANTGRALVVTVNSIDTSSSPGLADITIELQTMPTTPSPAMTSEPTIFRGANLTSAPTLLPTPEPTFPSAPTLPTPAPEAGANGDPIILGLQNQIFKFIGRDGAWYSNVSNKYLKWNMQFRQFDSCPDEENMFISGITLTAMDESARSESLSNIMIMTTPEPTSECKNDPDLACLGEGTLHLSFDKGQTFTSTPGDYHYGSRSRVVVHNTYAACSRKWHDYDISPNKSWRNVRDGGRRTTIQEKKPLRLLADRKAKMIDPDECDGWIKERISKNDLFQQRGLWSTVYVETPMVSFHIEYRRSDWYSRQCDFQSLDAWMTNVDESMQNTEWNGILGETKNRVYDLTSGEQIKTDRSQILRGKDDADYEVGGPFETEFAALGQKNGFNRIISSAIDSIFSLALS